ncbi:MAG: MerR family transcriptional regulator [Candidatus Limnocylindrales bacterium]
MALGDASTLLGVSAATLRRWSDAGQVPVFTTPGGHRRYSRRALAALLPTGHRDRHLPARLGASVERIARVYRGTDQGVARRRRPATMDVGWVNHLADGDREAFRHEGRVLVEVLLQYLEAAPGDEVHLERAVAAASAHGRHMAQLGRTTVEAVEAFLRFREPFLEELRRLAASRGLGVRDATALLARVDRALDRLLIATVEGHAGADTLAGSALDTEPEGSRVVEPAAALGPGPAGAGARMRA